MADLTPAQLEYVRSQRLGRIATAGKDGKPHVVPSGFQYNAELGTIDVGGRDVASTKKYRDVEATGYAAIVFDDLASTNPWHPRMLEIRGRAEAIANGGDGRRGVGGSFVRIHIDKVNAFGID